MAYMDPDVLCPENADKLNHSLRWIRHYFSDIMCHRYTDISPEMANTLIIEMCFKISWK